MREKVWLSLRETEEEAELGGKVRSAEEQSRRSLDAVGSRVGGFWERVVRVPSLVRVEECEVMVVVVMSRRRGVAVMRGRKVRRKESGICILILMEMGS